MEISIFYLKVILWWFCKNKY